MWLKEWDQLLRIVTIGLPVYLALILMLRLVGTRSLSKNNAFDSVVTFALGSALATAIMTPELPGAVALGSLLLLVGLQFVISWVAVRVGFVEQLTKSTPQLLLHEGSYLEERLKACRMSPGAVRAAIRTRGIARIEDVYAVVLETDGSLSVLTHDADAKPTALRGVDGVPDSVLGSAEHSAQ